MFQDSRPAARGSVGRSPLHFPERGRRPSPRPRARQGAGAGLSGRRLPGFGARCCFPKTTTRPGLHQSENFAVMQHGRGTRQAPSCQSGANGSTSLPRPGAEVAAITSVCERWAACAPAAFIFLQKLRCLRARAKLACGNIIG
ncbi:unnamed protein product, partial [Amoebophrya sp. A120]|eukprot:GSA120T00006745001.1